MQGTEGIVTRSFEGCFPSQYQYDRVSTPISIASRVDLDRTGRAIALSVKSSPKSQNFPVKCERFKGKTTSENLRMHLRCSIASKTSLLLTETQEVYRCLFPTIVLRPCLKCLRIGTIFIFFRISGNPPKRKPMRRLVPLNSIENTAISLNRLHRKRFNPSWFYAGFVRGKTIPKWKCAGCCLLRDKYVEERETCENLRIW